jgi:hypothetical protein
MKKKYTNTLVSSLMFALLLTAPSIGFAKENENKGKNKDEKPKIEKSEKRTSNDKNDDQDEKNKSFKNTRGCFKAFGHFIAPGWIKNNGNIDDAYGCHFPFGIDKKFRGNNASSTPDTIAPVISAVTFRTAKNQTVVTWTTNERTDSTVFFGTTTPVAQSGVGVNVITQNGFVKNHAIVVKKLNPDTTYYVTIRSRDTSGNTSVSENLSFKTKAPSVDIGLPIISNIVVVTSTSTAKIAWKTNEDATGRVYYSQTLPVIANSSTTSFVDSAILNKERVVTIPNLNPNTTYYFVVESTDSVGNVSVSATFTGTTGIVVTPDITAPVISSVVGTAGTSTANVSWTTNELATSKVFYSTSTPVVAISSTPSITNTTLKTNHGMNLSGLSTSTQYYILVQSTDSSNNTQTGTQFSVTTGN